MKPSLPAMYLPHGGGPSFFMQGPRKQMYLEMEMFLRGVIASLATRPKAILLVSAHWEAPVPTFAGNPQPGLIYDYYGFPEATYQLTYPAPGAPELATQAAELLQSAGIPAQVDPDYGWDHGVFVPLKVMLPDANLPVLAMSLHASLDPRLHYAMGRALQPLRDQGVLIVGSGMSFHNLRNFAAGGPDSERFDAWLDQALAGDHQHRESQLAVWHNAPSGRAAHPREEHLIPLMVAAGAGSEQPARKLWSGLVGPARNSGWAFD